MQKKYNTGGLVSGIDFKWNDSLVNWYQPLTLTTNGITFTSSKKENFEIERVLFNEPATIVWFKDNSKVIVKCQNGEKFDKEKGLALACMKKMFGNKSNFNNEIKKWCSKENESEHENV